jgi:hypothetical protein
LSAQGFFLKQWNDFTSVTPLALKIHDLFRSQGEVIENDHIALRTLAHPSVGITAFADFFKTFGYEIKDEYFFEQKRLRAIYLKASDNKLPLVFISELLYRDPSFSSFLQESMGAMVAASQGNSIEQLFLTQKNWQPCFLDYQKLASESEYAAWLYAWGFRTNHFTLRVNVLKKYPDIAAVNQLLKEHGHLLNVQGGEIKGSPEQGLVQSSTMADQAMVHFKQGDFLIPSCYYEFARRYEIDGQLYTGFIPSSADKIFESTHRGDQ